MLKTLAKKRKIQLAVGGGVALIVGALFIFSAVSHSDPIVSHELIVDTVSPTDDTVPNGDNVLYQIRGSVNGADAKNVVVRLEAENSNFDIIPELCLTEGVDPISQITYDVATKKSILECNIGDHDTGYSFRFEAAARTNGANGGNTGLNVEISSPQGNTATGVGVPKRIKTDFSADIGIAFQGASYAYGFTHDVASKIQGGPGVAVPLLWKASIAKGSERPADNNFSIDITLKNPTHIPYQDGFSGIKLINAPNAGSACLPIYGVPVDDIGQLFQNPNYDLAIAASNGEGINQNSNSGKCTVTGSGDKYKLKVEGIDTSMLHTPQKSFYYNEDNYSLPKDEVQYASGMIWFWIPETWLIVNGEPLISSITAEISNYTTASGGNIVGEGTLHQSNDGGNSSNDTAIVTIWPYGGWDAGWVSSGTIPKNLTASAVAGQETGNAVDGGFLVHSSKIRPTTDGTDIMCHVLGDDYSFAYVKDVVSFVGDGVNYVTEYSTKALTADPTMSHCADADGPWIEYNKDAPPADNIRSQIKRVRMKVDYGVGSGYYLGISVFHKLKENLNVGQYVWGFGNFFSDGGITWLGDTYNHHDENDADCGATRLSGEDYPCAAAYHDALEITGAKVTTEKTTIDNKNLYSSGGIVPYRLRVLSIHSPSVMGRATVTDVLDAGLEYIDGSANIAPASVRQNTPSAGKTTIVWNLENVASNTYVDVDYDARVIAETGTLSLSNTVVTSVCTSQTPFPCTQSSVGVLDERSDDKRSASKTINITSSGYTQVTKTTNHSEVRENEPIVFDINIENHDAETHAFTDVIDILPYNDDNRVPATNFKGSYKVDSVSSNQKNVKIYYTTANPDTVNADPRHSSNGSAGDASDNTVGWALLTEDGFPSWVTAIRAIGEAWAIADDPIHITVTLQPVDNKHWDVYTNNFGAITGDTKLVMFSNDVNVRVAMPPTVSIDKDDGKEEVHIGETLTYTVTVANTLHHSLPITNIIVKDEIPEWLEYLSAEVNGFTGADCDYKNNIVNCPISEVSYGLPVTVTVKAKVKSHPPSELIINTVTIIPGEDVDDLCQRGGSSCEDMDIDKIFTPTPPDSGNMVITAVSSAGVVALAGIVLWMVLRKKSNN